MIGCFEAGLCDQEGAKRNEEPTAEIIGLIVATHYRVA
jgi:hypothetical protein